MSIERKTLKILHIDPETAWGGGESELIGLLHYLASWGHKNLLLCHPEGILRREAERRGIHTLAARIRNDLDMRLVPFLRRLLRSEEYDIVHFHTRRAHGLALCLGHVRPEVRFVVTRRMDYPVSRSCYHDYLYNQRVDGIIANSHKIAEVLIEGRVAKQKIRVIYTGIEPEPFRILHRVNSNIGKLVIGTVAGLQKRKGHQFLLQAAALLKQKGYRLEYHFAGDGPERQHLQKTTEELGLQQDVIFEGFLSNIRKFLVGIDIFVLPSLWEGLGVAVLEAMAAGKPVIASKVGGLPEIIDDEITGLLIPPGNINALVDSISRLVSQRTLMDQMGIRGRERVGQRFTMHQTAKMVQEYYYDLLRGTARDDEQ